MEDLYRAVNQNSMSKLKVTKRDRNNTVAPITPDFSVRDISAIRLRSVRANSLGILGQIRKRDMDELINSNDLK